MKNEAQPISLHLVVCRADGDVPPFTLPSLGTKVSVEPAFRLTGVQDPANLRGCWAFSRKLFVKSLSNAFEVAKGAI